ncbi:multicomponent Na+:H+ antiporter subunit E [Halorubrum alkaliphilum]|uniref:Multicomponent Na+:H+ antiporter subunit E n=1 Tax=Halorubrum alkaliphilum TaxID=261290 RepID=A0A8T4GE80_9EURY|nr:monovalent cation/H+ antiporter subunit E [Halorubrum alkaliphilum]MBP1922443.1 multicomponent Na+:H+ antiporter subunit E [Halorubrum alkaliphilum]
MADDDTPPPERGSVVVPVESTSTLRTTVTHLIESAAAGEFESIHFVVLASWRRDDPETAARNADAERLLDRVSAWADADLDDAEVEGVEIATAVVGADEYLFGPGDYAREIVTYADDHGIDSVVLDPEYTPVGNTTLLQPLAFELSNTDLVVREAPVSRPTRRERLRKEATGKRFAALFGASFAFYLLLGDPLYWFDWLTGVASAAIVAITLSRVSIDTEPSFPRTPMRVLRGLVYVPVLLFEILKSNLVVARVILDPRLPIDPTLNRVRVLVGSGLPLMTLANSITLTPGTLTVRARDGDLYVQSLIPWARDGLFDGSLERWTRFIYYGREAARLPTPRERDDVAVFQGPDATEELPLARADGGDETDRRHTDTGATRDAPTGSDADETTEVTDE